MSQRHVSHYESKTFIIFSFRNNYVSGSIYSFVTILDYFQSIDTIPNPKLRTKYFSVFWIIYSEICILSLKFFTNSIYIYSEQNDTKRTQHTNLVAPPKYSTKLKTSLPRILSKFSPQHPDSIFINLEIFWAHSETLKLFLRQRKKFQYLPEILTTFLWPSENYICQPYSILINLGIFWSCLKSFEGPEILLKVVKNFWGSWESAEDHDKLLEVVRICSRLWKSSLGSSEDF